MNSTQKPKTSGTTLIEKFSHDGRGIARIEGKTTFIAGVLPGETVKFKYTHVKKNYDEGIVLEVLQTSPHRVKPRCVHYNDCGGCSLQHLDEISQIHVKEGLMLDVLRRIAQIEPESLMPPLHASSWHYRNKARLTVRYVAKKVLIGFRKKLQARDLAAIETCPILHEKLNAALPLLRETLNALETKTSIVQIEAAVGDNDQALVFKTVSPMPEKDLQKLATLAAKLGFMFFLQPDGSRTLSRLYPAEGSNYLHYSLPAQGVQFQFCATDFTQINPAMNRKMINLSLELLKLDKGDNLLDLFCGLGNFSLSLAPFCSQVTGIEGSIDMVQRAKDNAIKNKLANARFYCADLSKNKALTPFLKESFTKILLDPPRTGALEMINQISQFPASAIVYVSCNPATFARDAGILVKQHGYRLKKLAAMDMFPHTTHVESIALFERG